MRGPRQGSVVRPRALVTALLAVLLLLAVPVATGRPFDAVPFAGNPAAAGTGDSGTSTGGIGVRKVGTDESYVGAHLPPADRIYFTSGRPGIALTFDDGPDPVWTPQVLRLLARYRARATFCLIGQKAQRYPQLVRAISTAGHTLCNHTMYHRGALGSAPPALIARDLSDANAAITRASGGVPPAYVRAPQGRFTPAMIRTAKRLRLASLGWRMTASDWMWPPKSPAEIQSAFRRDAAPGAIMLFHDSGSPGTHAHTVTAIRLILQDMRRQNLPTSQL